MPQPDSDPPSIIDAYLKRFVTQNPHVVVRTDSDTLIVESPWGAGNVNIACGLHEHDFLSELNHVWLNPVFDAIIHLDTNTMEILFAFLDPKDEISQTYVDRAFSVFFEGVKFDCRYAAPSDRFMSIARRSQSVLSNDPGQTVPQLAAFRDFQRLDQLPDRAKKYFKDKLPRNFHITSDKPIAALDLIRFAHHLNFISDYYDRRAPEIVIRETSVDDKDDDKRSPLRFVNKEFPSELSVGGLDEILRRLNHVARRAPSRQAFVYYYQVIE